MKHSKMKWSMLLILMAAIMVLGACKKKVAPAPPPPPPAPPAAPTASLSADPNTIEKGQSTTLTWQTTNATDVTLGPNKVDATGSATVSPTDSTTFHLVAKGAGGTQEATARVTVTMPAAPPPPQPTATDQGYAVSPSWSPNGQFLAFSWIRHYGPGAPGNQDIYVMDIASKQFVQLTHDAGRNDFPSWSPDGRHLVFQSDRKGRWQIWSMLADGTQQQALTNSGENTQPNWSFK